ncbi:MAG: helix-turn-helix domain-containing protein [Janthinobacterium lividum]
MLTGEQLRAARAMLKVEQGELAEASGVSVETIKRLERMDGFLAANTKTLDSLRRALEADGVIFIPENGGLAGVRLRRDPPANIRTRVAKGRRPVGDEVEP